MMRSTFSITTMASSTTMPIASTSANIVSWLMVKPMTLRPQNVPSRATGMTRVGMMVARKFCRNTSITRNTRITASIRVLTTSSIEIFTNVVVSYGENQVTPGGKLGCSSSILARTASATFSALAPGSSWIANAPTGLPLNWVSKPKFCAPNSTRATSFRRTVEPSLLARRMICSNCSGEVKRPSADTVAVNAWPSGAGSEPIEPAANCTFCARTAVSTSVADRLKPCSLPGSSHRFMAYSDPKCWVLPTPGTRAIWSSTREATMSFRRLRSMLAFSDCRPTTIRKPALALATTTPWAVTSLGRRGVASDTLFCTCTWAISASVPVWKVSVIEAWPDELELELKYSRLSMPVSCCSMTWVTERSVVSALAPG